MFFVTLSELILFINIKYVLSSGNSSGIDGGNGRNFKTDYGTLSSDNNSVVEDNDQLYPKHVQLATREEGSHHASLIVNSTEVGRFSCGGSIISKHHVLTSADCLFTKANNESSQVDNSEITVIVGVLKMCLSCKNQRKKVVRTFIHPLYDPKAFFEFDLAVVKCDSDFKFSSSVSPIKYPHPGMSFGVGHTLDQMLVHRSECYITGFIDMEVMGKVSPYLVKVKVKLMTFESCEPLTASEGFKINKYAHICAVEVKDGVFTNLGFAGSGMVCPSGNQKMVWATASEIVKSEHFHSPIIFARVDSQYLFLTSSITDNRKLKTISLSSRIYPLFSGILIVVAGGSLFSKTV